MNLQARKIEFVQEFLKIKNEKIIARFEKLLFKEKNLDLKPMSVDELNDRIDQSEDDFKNDRQKTHSDLMEKSK